jgi:hypothetical protein
MKKLYRQQCLYDVMIFIMKFSVTPFLITLFFSSFAFSNGSTAQGILDREVTLQIENIQLKHAFCLIYAEAQNESGGPNAEAHNALRLIRDRAGLTTPALGTFNQATFREAVWKERWHELSFECITWFDMTRLRKVYEPTTDTFVDFVGASLNGTTLQEKHLLLPLPAADFRNNPNLQPNNPGW